MVSPTTLLVLSSCLALPLLSFAAATGMCVVARREHKNNRLWFKCNLKLGHLMYEVGDMGRLQRIIKELLRWGTACFSFVFITFQVSSNTQHARTAARQYLVVVLPHLLPFYCSEAMWWFFSCVCFWCYSVLGNKKNVFPTLLRSCGTRSA